MSSEFEIVGFTARSPETYRNFESDTGILPFRDAEELIDKAKPAFLIVAVPSGKNETTILRLLDRHVPILTETPAAWSAAGVRRILQKAMAKNVTVAVAEQCPFLPLERFKKELIELGIFGDIFAACNDFETGRYHGIAQIRRYLKGKPATIRNFEQKFGASYNSLVGVQRRNILWQSALDPIGRRHASSSRPASS